MKKWILVLGLVGCSLLFFISGSFVGYLTFEQKTKETPQKKPQRKPLGMIVPILGQVAQNKKVTMMNKVRMPTPDAVMKAQQYQEQYLATK